MLARSEPCARALTLLPHDFARRHRILAVRNRGAGEPSEFSGLRILTCESTSPAAIVNTRTRLGERADALTVEAEALVRRIDAAYADSATRERDASAASATGEGANAAEDLDSLLAQAERDLLSTSGKAPIVKLVDALVFDAIGRGASDLHVQPLADRVQIRYRVDGTLATVRTLDRSFLMPIVSRVKVMGSMDIAERRLPQDGRATVTIGSGASSRSIDLRISSLPTSCGERVVVRVLDQSRGERLQSFDALGMPEDVTASLQRECLRSHGLILVTGPTGSGKSTTLYTTLRWISRQHRARWTPSDADNKANDLTTESPGGTALNIMTIEDPVEFALSLPGVEISQTQVNNTKGVTFATGLRHILRQDPDVIMVGEVRDAETARLAIQASLTGHLVFSTLHTNDAASSVTRLFDLGVEPYLVASSLNAVLAQRLVRLVHQPCRGEGCDGCLGTGFTGRSGIYELLLVDDSVRPLVTSARNASDIRAAALAAGMRSLRRDGERLLATGRTTATELDRVTTLSSEDPA